MITILLPFWKKFCFILSARGSAKDQTMIHTVSGHTISQDSLTDLKESSESEREYESLNKHIERGYILFKLTLSRHYYLFSSHLTISIIRPFPETGYHQTFKPSNHLTISFLP